MPAPPDPAACHAIILAAGVGRRLAENVPGHAGKPKALLSFDGRTLIERHAALLRAAGVGRVTVVVGYGAEQMQDALAAAPGGPVEGIFNPDFREGSVVSLSCAHAILRGGASVILMDADVIYDGRVMERLLGSQHENCLLLDREIEPGDEPVKICIRDGRIVDFRKMPTEAHDWHGESVGFFRFAPDAAAELAGRAEFYIAQGRRMTEYEEPIRDMMMASRGDRFGFEDISGLPWTEIDFAEDVAKAEALLPELAA